MRGVFSIFVAFLLEAFAASPAAAQDVFSSGGGGFDGGVGPRSSRPTGKQAVQDDSVYCQQTPEGTVIPKPYGGTHRNIPCGLPRTVRAPAPKPTRPAKPPPPIFNYYYINGINTPYGSPIDDGHEHRGNYVWDRKMIAANLLDKGPHVGPSPQKAAGQLPNIRVSNEIDVLGEETYNPSGTEPLALTRQFCDDARNGRLPPTIFGDNGTTMIANACDRFQRWRGQGLAGMSPGDVLEAFRQSGGMVTMPLDPTFAAQREMNIVETANQPDVVNVTRIIVRIYEAEKRSPAATRRKNYFVLIAHSQGNFFAEGVAYRLCRLEGAPGREITQKRFGVMSFASPTHYDSLGPDCAPDRLKHFTRADDGIHALDVLAILGKKTPFSTDEDLPPLWPWPQDALKARLQLPAFFDTLSWAPPAGKCKPIDEPECDGALYTPLMNAHLLDNYLADPPLTVRDKPIATKTANALGLIQPFAPEGSEVSPRSFPVLRAVRLGLADLKRRLLATEQASVP